MEDKCDYIIVIQKDDFLWEDPTQNLPKLPSNARYLSHPNKCFDIGTVGWVLKTQIEDISRYKFFFWLNSSVRGPFLPPSTRGLLHWTRPFTNKLWTYHWETPVKLVGATINCGGVLDEVPSPHVQSYITATDSIGLQVLLNTKGVFSCWKRMSDVVRYSEIGASKAILDAGYNLDSLMTRYQGLDWRLPELRNPDTPCNELFNPIQPGFNDGIDIHPYEVMFVKVKESLLEAKWKHSEAAVTIDRWFKETERPGGDISIAAALKNNWIDVSMESAFDDAKRRGKKCFDSGFYLKANAYDLDYFEDYEDPGQEAWDQFIKMGFYEGRPHRWKC